MIKEMFEFLAEKGLLSPTIIAMALIAVVYFQGGVDAEQRTLINDLNEQQRATSKSMEEATTNNRITAVILSRIDEQGTKALMTHLAREAERREQALSDKEARK